jgi:hypothetical protein
VHKAGDIGDGIEVPVVGFKPEPLQLPEVPEEGE